MTCCMAVATDRSSVAMTVAAAMPAMISLARLGPLSAAAGWPGSTSLMTSVIRSSEPFSSPLLRLITGTHGCRWGRTSSRVSRKALLGTPTTNICACRDASSRSAVAFSRSGRGKPFR